MPEKSPDVILQLYQQLIRVYLYIGDDGSIYKELIPLC